MTSKKGSLWKTSWNRGRGAPPSPIVGNMAFFQNFRSAVVNNAFYTTGVLSTLGAALPFWFGVVGIRPLGDQKFSAPNTLDSIRPTSDTDLVNINGTVNGLISVTFDLSVAAPGNDNVCAALVQVTKDPSGTTFTVRVRLCDQVEQVVHGDAASVPPAFPLTMSPNALPGAFHGLCGGPGVLTADEMKTWFKQLKATLVIPGIPGKTTHRYSAGVVFPLVPALLANLGTDATQNMTLTTVGAPAPANVLIPVRFPY